MGVSFFSGALAASLAALLTTTPAASLVAAQQPSGRRAFLQARSTDPKVIKRDDAPGLDQVVLDRAQGNAESALAAQATAVEDKKLAEVTAAARGTFENAEKARRQFRLAETAVNEAKMERTRARRANKSSYEYVAQVEKLYGSIDQDIVEKASDEAADKIVRQIGRDAKRDAQRAFDRANKNYAKNRKRKIAEAVADAMQPYHLTVLRLQKTVETMHKQSHEAMEAAKNLQGKAEQMAADAQGMQGKGMSYQANELMQQAHGMMNGAVNLKKQAEKMYGQANDVNASIGGYQLYEGQAGANAAATTTLNKPISLDA